MASLSTAVGSAESKRQIVMMASAVAGVWIVAAIPTLSADPRITQPFLLDQRGGFLPVQLVTYSILHVSTLSLVRDLIWLAALAHLASTRLAADGFVRSYSIATIGGGVLFVAARAVLTTNSTGAFAGASIAHTMMLASFVRPGDRERHDILSGPTAPPGLRLAITLLSAAAAVLLFESRLGLRAGSGRDMTIEADVFRNLTTLSGSSSPIQTGATRTKPESSDAGRDVSRQPWRIVFTQGHGEKDPASSDPLGYATLTANLKRDIAVVDRAALTETAFPVGGSLIFIGGPTTDLLPREIDVLRRHVAAGGALLVALDPPIGLDTAGNAQPSSVAVPLANLRLLVREWGIDVGNNLVVKNPSEWKGDFWDTLVIGDIIRSGTMHNLGSFLFPVAQSMSPIAGGTHAARPFLQGSEHGWAESDLPAAVAGRASFDESSDKRGPVTIAATASMPTQSIERREAASDARVIAVGDSDFCNNFIIAASSDNLRLTMSMVNWLSHLENGAQPMESQWKNELDTTEEADQAGEAFSFAAFASVLALLFGRWRLVSLLAWSMLPTLFAGGALVVSGLGQTTDNHVRLAAHIWAIHVAVASGTVVSIGYGVAERAFQKYAVESAAKGS